MVHFQESQSSKNASCFLSDLVQVYVSLQICFGWSLIRTKTKTKFLACEFEKQTPLHV